MRGHVAVVGSVNMDLVIRCQRLPHAGETISGSGFERAIGGKGANQAVAIARAGRDVKFIGAVGRDGFGDEAADLLRAEGIDTEHLRRVAEPTGIAMIMVETSSAQNCIVLNAGANASLSVQDVERCAEVIASASMLVCQLETPLDAVLRSMQIARSAGVAVLLNPAPAMALPSEWLPLVDILVPNEHEAASLMGMHGVDGFDADMAARTLRGHGAGAVIITLGARGAVCADGSGLRRFDALPAKAVDTTGAGDTFIGALVASRVLGATLHQAIDWAQRAAAISVERRGAMVSIPRAREVPGFAEWIASSGR